MDETGRFVRTGRWARLAQDQTAKDGAAITADAFRDKMLLNKNNSENFIDGPLMTRPGRPVPPMLWRAQTGVDLSRFGPSERGQTGRGALSKQISQHDADDTMRRGQTEKITIYISAINRIRRIIEDG
jgi:hypothetical protein